MNFDNEIVTVTEAAKICKVTRATIWRWIKSGLLNAGVTAGGHYRISRGDLDRLIESKGMMPCSRTEINTHKVLIVDDDPSVRKLLTRACTRNGCEVDSAADGFEAGVKTVKFQPQIVILDLFMPKMDGFEVCRQLKKNRDTASIKIIAISGDNDPKNRDRILDYGADRFFSKPVDIKMMIREINKLIKSDTM